MDSPTTVPRSVAMNAQIEPQEAHEKNKKIITYKVMVERNNQKWFVFRRYGEFGVIHEKLKKLFPDAGLKLPGKRLFFGSTDPAFLKQRRDGLDEYIQKILSNPQMCEVPEVKTFLGLDKQVFTEEKLDNDPVDEVNEKTTSTELDSEEPPMNLGTTENKKASPSQFDFLKVIGKGSFGKVYLARFKGAEKIYAVKVLSKEQIKKRNEVAHIMSERNVLVRTLRHPFLCSLHYSFQTATKLYFVLDYVNGGELFFHLQRERCFSEPRAQFYSAEMASAIGYLHANDIIYRDLKPENILLDNEGHIILTDFGLCKEGVRPSGTTHTFCGTPEYLAPEVLRKEPYDRAVDWWCLGSVLHEMLFGLPPFYSRDTAEMYRNILYKPLRLKPNCSMAAASLITGLLQKEPIQRLGSRLDFEELRRHEFYRSLNWQALVNREIQPPFKPMVFSSSDTRNIDPEFTKEAVTQSVGRSVDANRMSASVMEADDTFMGFSYVPPIDEDNE